MKLSEDAIKEYQEIYFKEFGKHISAEEANKQGEKLLRLMRLVYKPLKKE